MSQDSLADRLRANLALARMPVPEADFQRVLASSWLRATWGLARELDEGGDTLPDYAAAWDDDATPPEASRGATDGGSGAPPHAPRIPPADGVPTTITEWAPRLRAGEISPVELVERSLERIAARDAELNAFQLVLDEQARQAARRAEDEIARGEWRGPLHGIPVAVKDLFAMQDTITTSGGKARGAQPDETDATAVARLRDAGAIIVGKTRLPEFAFWPGSANPHYGPTANPHDTGRDAGGSSSGSAVAVADGMAVAALGSDTGGSIRIPAALCGVVGLKPTFGRVSLAGATPLSWSLDHAGPLTGSVEDAALVLEALAGRDVRDPRTRPGSEWTAPRAWERAGGGASRGQKRSGGRAGGLRVGVLGSDGSQGAVAEDAAMAAWRASCLALEREGATLVEVDLLEMAQLRAANLVVLSVEAATYHAAALRTRYRDYGEICRIRLLGGFAFGAADFVRAQRYRRAVRARWRSIFDRIDVLSTPSQPDVAPPLGEMASVKFTNPFNGLGWPAVSVPFATGPGGLPLATQLVGRPWDEATVLTVARLLEAAR